MDGNTQTELNSSTNRGVLIGVFPLLKGDVNFEILSPETPIYNCIAWAMQFNDRWVSIGDYPGYWWPDGVAKNMSSDALIKAFEAVGFSVTSDCKIEKDFDKVVLYKNDKTNEWTHASRIVADAIEHSKFGQLWDGSHSTNSISGIVYGTPYCYMKRSKSYNLQPEKLHGNIGVDLALLQSLLKK